ncbi:MAG TPA: hypothetical protein HA319_04680 [Nitrosopumilaceae archaeon]|nr:hypothetical protein [Nitrosopumilaceae archaeon]
MKEETKRVTTSIKINPEIWKEAKIEAIQREVDLSELVENALKKELKGSKLKGGKL